MTATACRQCRTDAVLEPGIVKAVADFHPACTVSHSCIVTTAKLVQQVGLDVNYAFFADFFTNVKPDTADSTFNTALFYFDTITGNVVIPTQIT